MLEQIDGGEPSRYEGEADEGGIPVISRRTATRRWRALFTALAVLVGTLVLATGAPAQAETTGGLTCQGHLYTVNSYADNVSVIDTSSNQVIATIPVGKSPGWAVFTPDKKQLYVSNNAGSSISVIDIATNAVVKTIPTADSPIGLAFTPDGKRLLVSYIGGTVNSITVATGEATAPLKVGVDPEQIRITPDGRYLYLASSLQGIYKVDVNQMRVAAVIPAGDFKGGVVPFLYNLIISADGAHIYVAETFAGLIADIDTRTNRIVKTWPATGPVGLQLSPDRQRLYVTNFWGASLDEYSVATGAKLRTSGQTPISLPSHLAEGADGRYLYFGESFDTKLEVFDSSTWKPVKTLTVGSGPNSLAICDSASPR